ncbi:hypothetical protein MMC09_001517 [Bachmanniomyces sp. S44760]|nr:hypothetical protein [Bachmanniomyces sp. S44760]
MRVFDAPFCSPFFEDRPPKKVLEIACGAAVWSSACHDFFKRQGWGNVSFTGLDIAPLAPDLRTQGVNWRFVQADIRKQPLPFSDGEFDFIFIKDAGYCCESSIADVNPLSEPLRILKRGGVLEVLDSDDIVRTLLPNPPIPHGTTEEEVEQAEQTATYIISASTAFAKTQNRYFQDYNTWIEKGLEKRDLTAVRLPLTAWAFSSVEAMRDVGSRRVAIPFGVIRWEKIRDGAVTASREATSDTASPIVPKDLTPNQFALRQTALGTTIQAIESLELVLKPESEKRQDEWDRWWSGMTHNLLEQNGAFNGECLEIGAFWARKR